MILRIDTNKQSELFLAAKKKNKIDEALLRKGESWNIVNDFFEYSYEDVKNNENVLYYFDAKFIKKIKYNARKKKITLIGYFPCLRLEIKECTLDLSGYSHKSYETEFTVYDYYDSSLIDILKAGGDFSNE